MSMMRSNKAILQRLASDPSLSEYDRSVLESVFVVPAWMVVADSLRWVFVVLPLASLGLPIWANLIIGAVYVFADMSLPGLSEKGMFVLQIVALILSIVKNGLSSWFTLSFILFIAWYIGSWIMSARWLRERMHILTAYSEQDTGTER